MTRLATARVREMLRAAELRALLVEELGWDRYRGSFNIVRDGITYRLVGLAEKRGLVIFECTAADGTTPPYQVRVALEAELRRSVHEHIIVFLGLDRHLQIWQWVRREPGRPRATREHQFHSSQAGDALIAKLSQLAFELDEEESLTISHVTQRARSAFDVEAVTRRFFERFQQEHHAFLSFIRGFANSTDAEWYASLMMNRLMFVYFVQKRGFIDDDRNYLQNRLRAVQTISGTGAFHGFYRYFLLRLFHDGLGAPAADRDPSLEPLLGQVPYLNGGLFDVHVLERSSPELDIPDEAFERLFAFFDSYNWHLDDRPLQRDNEINPDVLGYIFEKYINQKEMGAYYTKEDITGYITGNAVGLSIIAQLDETLLGRLRELMREHPERYLPPQLFVDELPGETAAAAADRAQLRDSKIEALRGGLGWSEAVAQTVDLTVVLDDAVQVSTSEELQQVWSIIRGLTILDPTCGSGAFLFAALRVLEPLLGACVDRMAVLVGAQDGAPATLVKYSAILADLACHPNQQYFILKSILLNNLYGVDLMEEAVEICKLRLFLKLASSLQSASELEPLPDIDFNIRGGNTVIGFSTVEALKSSMANTMDFEQEYDEIVSACVNVDAAYNAFRAQQEVAQASPMRASKQALRSALNGLREHVDRHLLTSLGVTGEAASRDWLDANHPFHWFAEYHEILERGGFDVIVGNPPYAEVPTELSRQYLRSNYATALDRWSRDEDLYAFVVERSLKLLAPSGVFGMVLPLSCSFSTKRTYVRLREELGAESGTWWFSHYDRIPSALFGNDVRTRCTIAILARETRSESDTQLDVYVTELRRWPTAQRDALFGTLRYSHISGVDGAGIPKLGGQAQASAYEALASAGRTLASSLTVSRSFPMLANMAPEFPEQAVFVGGTAYNWFPVWRDIPPTTDAEGRPSLPARTACFLFASDAEADLVFALLGSSLGYWWWAVASDGFNLKKWLVDRFPLSPRSLSLDARTEIADLGGNLRRELLRHYVYKDNRGRVGNWYMPACAAQVKAIDEALSRHVAELTPTVMEEIRRFNARSSTAVIAALGGEPV